MLCDEGIKSTTPSGVSCWLAAWRSIIRTRILRRTGSVTNPGRRLFERHSFRLSMASWDVRSRSLHTLRRPSVQDEPFRPKSFCYFAKLSGDRTPSKIEIRSVLSWVFWFTSNGLRVKSTTEQQQQPVYDHLQLNLNVCFRDRL